MAMGMARLIPLSNKAVMSIRFSANGTWVDASAGPITLDKITWEVHFYHPAARAQISGKTRNGRAFSDVLVFNEDRAWNETTPGVGPKRVAASALGEREVWPKLFPFGAMLSIVEAQGTVKISQDAQGKTVITGKSPYEAFPVTITLDAKNQIEAVTVTHRGHTYRATFFGYNDVTPQSDLVRNKWEPAYMVPWVDRIVWTRDGRPYADFTTTEFKSNPYVVFPFPELLKAEAEEADPTYGYDKNNPGDDIRSQFSPEMREQAN
jgi:hypothetical protein